MHNLHFNKNIPIALTIIIFIVLFGTFVVKPSILGYSVYKQARESNLSIEEYGQDIEELKSKLEVTNKSLESCNSLSQNTLEDLKTRTNEISACNSELSSVNAELESSIQRFTISLDDLQEELNEKEMELESSELQYNLLAQNLANNLCCKAKVDNRNIAYYKVENNMVFCLETGELSISC